MRFCQTHMSARPKFPDPASSHFSLAALKLAIPGRDRANAGVNVKAVLGILSSTDAVHLVGRGTLLRHGSTTISYAQNVAHLQQAGVLANTFQDSALGSDGHSSQ